MRACSVRCAIYVAVGAAGIGAGVVAVFLAWSQAQEDVAPPTADRTLPFRECAAEAGLDWQMTFLRDEQGENFKTNLYDHGCGLAVADFDGDGKEDIYFCNQLGPNALYRNQGDGTFVEMAAQAGVALGDRVCVAATFADYDNDGRPDLFATSTRGGNVLFRNLGDGKFEDVTQKAGLTHVGHSQTAVFFDFDNDGWLDLFLTNTGRWTLDSYDPASRHWLGMPNFFGNLADREYNVLYRNNGDGTFTDVTAKVGLKGLGWSGDAVTFDYDADGHIDVLVTNMFGRCQLYRNNGNGTFAEVTLSVLGRTPFGSLAGKILDFNNDGRLDLFIVDMHSDMWMGLDWGHRFETLARDSEKVRFPNFRGPRVEKGPYLLLEEKSEAQRFGFRVEEVVFGNTFFRNEGGGKFTEISGPANLETLWPWSIASGDFDNDGFEDLVVPAGMGYPFWYWPNYLLMNRGDGTFRSSATELGMEPTPRGRFFPEEIKAKRAARSSRTAVTADFRGCGRLDIVTNNFNDRPYYFKNDFPTRNFIALRLQGTRSNRDAIGAVVRLYRNGTVMTRQVQAACGYLSHSSRTLHFGLGDRPEFDKVEITWPNGRRQTIRPRANQLHHIIEPNDPDVRQSSG